MKKVKILVLLVSLIIFMSSCVDFSIDDIKSIRLNWSPQAAYILNTPLISLEDKSITAYYEDGRIDDFPMVHEDVVIEGNGIISIDDIPHLDTNSVGRKSLSVSYGGIILQVDFYVANRLVRPNESIQAAIDVSNGGDHIYVFSDFYSENIDIDRSLTLTTSKQMPATIVQQANMDRAIIRVRPSSEVIVENFDILGLGANRSAIEISYWDNPPASFTWSNRVHITNNTFKGSFNTTIDMDNHRFYSRVYVYVEDNVFEESVSSEGSRIHVKGIDYSLITYINRNYDSNRQLVDAIKTLGQTNATRYEAMLEGVPMMGYEEPFTSNHPEWGFMDTMWWLNLSYDDHSFNPWEAYQNGLLEGLYTIYQNGGVYFYIWDGEVRPGFDHDSDGIFVSKTSSTLETRTMYLIEDTWYQLHYTKTVSPNTITSINSQTYLIEETD